MKQYLLFYLIIILFFTACQYETTHINPAVSLNYSETTVDSLISTHYKSQIKTVELSNLLEKEFKADFPDSKKTNARTSNELTEIRFKVGKTRYKAFYTNSTELVAYQYNIQENELPAVVKNAAVSKYPDHNFIKLLKATLSSETIYHLELERDNIKVIMLSDPDGNIIEKRYSISL